MTSGCVGGDGHGAVDASGSGADTGTGGTGEGSADGGTQAPGTSGGPSASTGSDDGSDTGSVTTAGATATGTSGDGGSTGDAGDDSTGGGSSGGTSTGAGSTGGQPLSDDPFDPTACIGVAWTGAEALAELAGMSREVLATATIQVRSRDCPGGTCGAWSDNADWTIHYLTYSGGVTTAYKDFLATMDFVLFDDGGTARLSMQHVTFSAGGYPDTDGVVYDLPPTAVNYPHLRAYDSSPDQPYYYTDLDYQVSDGELVLGDGCAVWTANPYGTGMPYTEQFGAVFHW